MQTAIVSLVITHVLIPLYFIYMIWRGRENNKLDWLLRVLFSGLFLVYLVIAGRWDWIGYYFRFVYPVLYLVAVFAAFPAKRGLPWTSLHSAGAWIGTGLAATASVFFAVFLGFTVWGTTLAGVAEEPVSLRFPLEDGWYYVGQGGDSPLLNHHNGNESQQYALDILALNGGGWRAGGLYPSDPARYVIFGATLYSPCAGDVVAAVDGLPDHSPPERDDENLAGNHVIVACQGASVVLAHMQEGSVTVEAGDGVVAGDLLGRVGNSGNTTEPHLHMHAVGGEMADPLAGQGVPMLIDERFLVRNHTVRR